MRTVSVLLSLPVLFTAVAAFTVGVPTARPSVSSTRIFLEDHIADLIDHELYREQHRKDFEREWMEKNRGAVLSRLRDDQAVMMEPTDDLRQVRKDQKLAKDDPARYCADRCLATGNCDVYEDMYVPTCRDCHPLHCRQLIEVTHRSPFSRSRYGSFSYSPQEVLEFCNDCVLSEGEEPCDIPDAFYEYESGLSP
ncbi:predicted protein [Phaeodactylum tricornutum CCAP 1055/1]|jgi:hypothetical protein|uniref:Uncharacterized protein n=1 Tax=Phaeodactylum tricornutum (strain CCAP 1055/1) TaxID=556484 RepID=B5Y3K3_PHATC|nr:predicted protein [Phaeodactylum tricornutum CCAP 1055/1]ACI65322.1 predicted protein [Phaeodactylum tricornutum CCAP 1055/1]|eukprot:XP_002185852.1 predicted protein [Phaeodactylum tricornutum CCAP 1055/1]